MGVVNENIILRGCIDVQIIIMIQNQNVNQIADTVTEWLVRLSLRNLRCFLTLCSGCLIVSFISFQIVSNTNRFSLSAVLESIIVNTTVGTSFLASTQNDVELQEAKNLD